eukprot:TRINITY_DN9450_c0_g2_i2.p8 TRINITY_DN9450_c0_g2~~TRINITY_DN9450_c0_g2_i2.p8  ORF type:complete len:135 (+),score=3.37 TRINITY_DN9450_c0_g2_i2:1770-2174(+)
MNAICVQHIGCIKYANVVTINQSFFGFRIFVQSFLIDLVLLVLLILLILILLILVVFVLKFCKLLQGSFEVIFVIILTFLTLFSATLCFEFAKLNTQFSSSYSAFAFERFRGSPFLNLSGNNTQLKCIQKLSTG